ncbi:hypothetical protein BBK36DRAFT_3448 [Trichoderma citrinoviride]|uniref:Transcription factor Iwr1 domain-containing protein n=1 Tax=Trichoderma citrinoviride TaxID=58853 RepID=A0A2T4BDN8_9HYPO|nr:hypothetical protein BBK36DRAFT_3448 [Trichoderma citrinoviride]PTB67436.1 hypothetical protein BBK36DRAFT_3448 [Trichoderma citrinoviride]
MSIPPQLIRVKRKRDDESPVTFLQLEEGAKRHRSDRNWVYQRRESQAAPSGPAVSRSDGKPVIHVSQPEDRPSPIRTHSDGRVSSSTSDIRGTAKRSDDGQLPEQRKFHVSRAMLAQASAAQGPTSAGISKHARHGPTIFVERTGRKKIIPRSSRQSLVIRDAQAVITKGPSQEVVATSDEHIEQRHLKKPGIAKRRDPSQEPPARHPLPQSLINRHTEDMDKITADMNQWVLDEIGANLHAMEVEKKQAEKPRFRPKAPEKRYQERHPAVAVAPDSPAGETADTPMADASEEEGDDADWIIEEYVRIPAHTMDVNVLPSDVGLLVLDGEEENMLFYGPPQDEDDEYAEDDEDENAENYYTADYPEDEVDTEDEYDRHAYMYRNANASDEEEFDDNEYDSDEFAMEGQDDDDDDARMDRIRQFMQRNAAFR